MAFNLEFTFDLTRVDPNTGELGSKHRIVCRSRVIGLWEQQFRGASFNNLQKPAMTDMQGIAFVGMVQAGLFEGNLNEFRQSFELDMISPLDLIMEKELAKEKERLAAEGTPMSELDELRFTMRFRKENQDIMDDEESMFGGGPTRPGR